MPRAGVEPALTAGVDLSRTLILGNTGAGKSWLARRIAARLGVHAIDLDTIHWLPGGYGAARARDEALALTRRAAEGERWVIEGIYGTLIDAAAPASTALVWLCPDDADCVANVCARGARGNADAAAFDRLLAWTASYRSRSGSGSHAGHAARFDAYPGAKAILRSRAAVAAFVQRHSLPSVP